MITFVPLTVYTAIVDNIEPVSFISIESGDDFILSFFVTRPDDPSDGRSLILSRDKKWEYLLYDGERGVRVYDEAYPEDVGREIDYLESIDLGKTIVEVKSTRSKYQLDMSRVDETELRAAKKILKKMNYDNRFKLTVV